MNRWLYRFSIGLAGATLFLIFVGGLVKTMGASLSVPDWPLSYGRLMPPMIGGIFYEHGHRLVAAAVGFLTVLLAVFFSLNEKRVWLRQAAWAAVGLVVLQGVLGGLTVLLHLPPPISIAHALLAQTFFCLVVSIAVWASPFWSSDIELRKEDQNRLPLHRLAFAFSLALYLQLILGAVLRHTGAALFYHITGAAVSLFIGLRIVRYGRWCIPDRFKGMRRLTLFCFSVLIFQIALGVSSYFILNHRFDVIPRPFPAQIAVTLHVMTGALALGLSVILSLVSYRTRPEQSPPIKTTLFDYFELTKPGISLMAGATALAGFVLGSQGRMDFFRLFHTCVGTLLVAASAGILNMLIERNTDAKMRRTKTRPLPSGRLNPGEALFLGTLSGVAGILYLSWMVNLLTAALAGLTLSVYLYAYTPLKKVSAVCVSIGAVAGALPPVMGWTAASGHLGFGALVLFAILFFWQFPHFLSLAWLYKEDYALAGLHMLPELRDQDRDVTAQIIIWQCAALLIVSAIPTLMGLTGLLYLMVALSLGGWMTFLSWKFLQERSRIKARQLFFASIAYMPLLVIFMVLNRAAA